MTLGEWMYEEEQRLMNGIDSWKEFQENRENKTESEDNNDERRSGKAINYK